MNRIPPTSPTISTSNQYALKLVAMMQTYFDKALTIGQSGVTVSNIEKLERLIDKIAKQNEKVAGDFVKKLDTEQKAKILSSITKAVGINVEDYVSLHATYLQTAIKTNVNLIEGLTGRTAKRVESLLFRALTDPAIRIKDELLKIKKTYRSSAKLIARDQGNKIISTLNEKRMTDLYQDSYTWSTSNDERVRTEHRKLDGKEFIVGKPPSIGKPGEPIQCRCVARFNMNMDALINKMSTTDALNKLPIGKINKAILNNTIDTLSINSQKRLQVLRGASFVKNDPVYRAIPKELMHLDLKNGDIVNVKSIIVAQHDLSNVLGNVIIKILKPDSIDKKPYQPNIKIETAWLPNGVQGKIVSIVEKLGKTIITIK